MQYFSPGDLEEMYKLTLCNKVIYMIMTLISFTNFSLHGICVSACPSPFAAARRPWPGRFLFHSYNPLKSSNIWDFIFPPSNPITCHFFMVFMCLICVSFQYLRTCTHQIKYLALHNSNASIYAQILF